MTQGGMEGGERQSVGKGDQTITLKQIIGQHWLYNGAVRGLPYRCTMVCGRTHAYVHMLCIRGGMPGSLCASGDWLDVCKGRQREGKANIRRELVTIKIIYSYL